MIQKYFEGDYLEVFRGLLHPFGAQMQDPNGNYSIRIACVDDEHLRRHLKGEITLAFDVCTKPKSGKAKARFIGFDIDQRFWERLPVYASVLRDFGIEKAAFATGGSTDSKGKIILCFREMMPKDAARYLAEAIHRDAYERSVDVLPERATKGDLEIFPINGDDSKYGGVLRVLGRQNHRNPNGPVETPFDLIGLSLNPAGLRPLSYGKVVSLSAKLGFEHSYDDLPPAVRKLIREPWIYSGHDLTIKRIMRVAHYFAMKYDGSPEGEVRYRNALSEIKMNSLDLPNHSKPTSSGDARNPIEEEIKSLGAWQRAVEKRWKSRALNENIPGKGVYDAMVRYVKKNGLMPHAFSVTERVLSGAMGVYSNAVRKQIVGAEKQCLLIRLHRGTPKTLGRTERGTRKIVSGTPAMYALVGFDETVAHVWSKACTDKEFQARLRAAPIGPWERPKEMPFIPTPMFWDLLRDVSWRAESSEHPLKAA